MSENTEADGESNSKVAEVISSSSSRHRSDWVSEDSIQSVPSAGDRADDNGGSGTRSGSGCRIWEMGGDKCQLMSLFMCVEDATPAALGP